MTAICETAISSLIGARLRELHITKVELVRHCGYRNVAKGIRRLDELCSGNFSRANTLLTKLPDALWVEACVVEIAITATKEAKQHEEEKRYRDNFRPHGIILCERSRPEPLWLAALIGIDNIVMVEFAEGSPILTYVRQALDGVREKQRIFKSSSLPAFGRPTGVVSNYTCNKAVEFDLDGKPLRVFDRPVRIGETTLSLADRPISLSELRALMGIE